MAITLKVNGRAHTLDLDPATPLLYALSDDLQLNGPKFGCGLGQCGACTVIVKGQAVRSCVTTVKSVEGSEITTLEGLGTPEKPHPIQQAFIDEQAAQCGFCVNAVIMTAKAFLDKNPKATEAEIQQAMSGVLCRCFTTRPDAAGDRAVRQGGGAMKLNRRDFLKASGALDRQLQRFARRGQCRDRRRSNQLDSWIAIAADGSITAYSGKEELGQGISTAQQQLVAEELSVPFNRVKLIYCDTALTPDQAHTSGSQSHPANFNSNNLAQAGATAREALLRMASQKLGVPVDQLTASDGVITQAARRRVTYGQLVEGKKFSLALDPNAKRKSPSEWTVLGKPIPRPDIPDLVTGQFEFVHNVRLPGMLHGRVVRPPVGRRDCGERRRKLRRRNAGRGEGRRQEEFRRRGRREAVAGDPGRRQAEGDLESRRRPLPDPRDVLRFAAQAARPRRADGGFGRRRSKLAGAATVLKATYLHPYQMHGSMGSSCAVADVARRRGDHLLGHASRLVSEEHLGDDPGPEA